MLLTLLSASFLYRSVLYEPFSPDSFFRFKRGLTPQSATMSGSTQVLKDFTTPDRRIPSSEHGEGNKDGSGVTGNESSNPVKAKPALVTPPEAASREEVVEKEGAQSPLQRMATDIESPEDRHVRFSKEMETKAALDSPSSNSTGSQRGLVSRRGGRCSPGRNLSKPQSAKDSVLELKAYRSPSRGKDEGDNVPSLCSTYSVKAVGDDAAKDSKAAAKMKTEDGTSSTTEQAGNRPASISCNAAIDQTSPLTSTEGDQSSNVKSPKPKAEDGRKLTAGSSRRNNVTFSPVPPPKQFAERVSLN
jgi:hypothetical protein